DRRQLPVSPLSPLSSGDCAVQTFAGALAVAFVGASHVTDGGMQLTSGTHSAVLPPMKLRSWQLDPVGHCISSPEHGSVQTELKSESNQQVPPPVQSESSSHAVQMPPSTPCGAGGKTPAQSGSASHALLHVPPPPDSARQNSPVSHSSSIAHGS